MPSSTLDFPDTKFSQSLRGKELRVVMSFSSADIFSNTVSRLAPGALLWNASSARLSARVRHPSSTSLNTFKKFGSGLRLGLVLRSGLGLGLWLRFNHTFKNEGSAPVMVPRSEITGGRGIDCTRTVLVIFCRWVVSISSSLELADFPARDPTSRPLYLSV